MSVTSGAVQGIAGSTEADVVVVGAGPAGSTTAAHLARAGLDVCLVEKTAFPREKVCGDGLTPRAVAQLVKLGIDTSEQAGWLRNKGLRILGGGHTLHMPWPELASFPDYGLVRRRDDFDELLARTAQKSGARLAERTAVTEPLLDERSGRVTGVRAKGPEGEPLEVRAPLVIAADGNSSRLSLALGRRPRDDRPMGVAVRAYYTSPRDKDDWLESWLELWDGSNLLPGYGWVFGMGDGTSNVGLGMLNTTKAWGTVDYRDLLRRWLDGTPEEWGLREPNRVGPVRGAALPMGFNRQPHYDRGLLLVGDAGGMVNPFNGEGIAYAMESGAMAAEVVAQALSRAEGPAREKALAAYPQALKDTWGGYFTLGRAFVKLIGDPRVMRVATSRGLSHETLMKFTLKLLANLTDPRGGDAMDRIINGLAKVAPSA
ncbi:geranylgeranyl reductase family protein [Motilibacter peucedani]|uniref:Geranylgeranyl reductase family protein n=1 Tax=Motilibacter peucedani TaxID=598650 RepID=A0A420XKL3_9ACTN|nr:geranylgeranyl reductase family protein [Motilibacter peucedani]RKS69204.1 geranylgeranyl reductase family protein [Motilibacter peucedani]